MLHYNYNFILLHLKEYCQDFVIRVYRPLNTTIITVFVYSAFGSYGSSKQLYLFISMIAAYF